MAFRARKVFGSFEKRTPGDLSIVFLSPGFSFSASNWQFSPPEKSEQSSIQIENIKVFSHSTQLSTPLKLETYHMLSDRTSS